MKTIPVFVALAVAVVCPSNLPAQAPVAQEVQAVRPDGTPVGWQRWVQSKAPVALVMWASWTPQATAVLDRLPAIQAACRAKGLKLAVIDVQEPMADGRRALEGRGVEWLGDRHGSVLKRTRAIRVPSLVILAADGSVVARLEATAEAVSGWSGG